MRAVTIAEFGKPDVLQLSEIAEPTPNAGEVAIAVAYAGINFKDVMTRQTGYQVGSMPQTMGLEVSGHICALGDGVNNLTVGQRVAAFTLIGGQAEVAVARAELTYAIPDGVGLRTAATLPTIVPTAWALVNLCARLREGDTVLAHSSSGGVGLVLGQFAKQAGAAHIYGTASNDEKADFARQHGYDEIFSPVDFIEPVMKATNGRGVDLAFDAVGGKTWNDSVAVLAPFGRITSYGNASGSEPWTCCPGTLAAKSLGATAYSISALSQSRPHLLRAIAETSFAQMVEGHVAIPITREFAMDEIADAHRMLESRQTMGKLVLRI